jgi:hypothetical protein
MKVKDIIPGNFYRSPTGLCIFYVLDEFNLGSQTPGIRVRYSTVCGAKSGKTYTKLKTGFAAMVEERITVQQAEKTKVMSREDRIHFFTGKRVSFGPQKGKGKYPQMGRGKKEKAATPGTTVLPPPDALFLEPAQKEQKLNGREELKREITTAVDRYVDAYVDKVLSALGEL